MSCVPLKLVQKSRVESGVLHVAVRLIPVVILVLIASTAARAGDMTAAEWLEEARRISVQGHRTPDDLEKAQDSALVLADRAMELAIADDDSLGMADILNARGAFFFRLKRYDSSLAVWLQALVIIRGAALEHTQLESDLLSRLYLYDRYVEPLRDRPAELDGFYRKLSVKPDSSSVRLFYTIGVSCGRLGLFDEMHQYFTSGVGLIDRVSGEDPWYVIRTLIIMAENISKILNSNISTPDQQQDSALALGKRALNVATEAYGPGDTMVAWVELRLGDYYDRLGDYTEAARLWEDAWEINRRHLPPEHIEYQGSIYRMAGYYRFVGRFAEAEPLYLQAVDLRTRTQGPLHPETAYMHMSLARLYHVTGRYEKAEYHYRQALFIREHMLEQNPSDMAQTHRYLGQLFMDRGNYAEAERWFLQALELRRNWLGDEHALTASLLMDLGTLYAAWGQLDRALESLQSAYVIYHGFHREAHPSIAACLESMAGVYFALGQVDSAGVMYSRALEVWSASSDRTTPSHLTSLRGLATVYRARGELAEAREEEGVALAFVEKTLGKHHPLYAEIALETADLDYELGKTASAKELFKEALAVVDTDELRHHPLSAKVRYHFARYLYRLGDIDGAADFAMDAALIGIDGFVNNATVLSERDALAANQKVRDYRNLAVSLELKRGERAEISDKRFIDLLLQTKGQVSDMVLSRYAARQSDDPALVPVLDSLAAVRASLSHAYVRMAAVTNGSAGSGDLEELRRTKRRLEERLSRLSTSGEIVAVTSHVSSQQIADAMPPGSAAVEYIRIDTAGCGLPGMTPRYIAVILPSTGSAIATSLASANVIDSLAAELRGNVRRVIDSGRMPDTASFEKYVKTGSQLRKLVMDPILKRASDARLLILAPDGDLCLVPFGALPVAADQFLIEQNQVHYVGALRDLLRYGHRQPHPQRLVAVGDPNFDLLPSRQFVSADEPSAALRSSCMHLDKEPVLRLPGTRLEVEQVSEIWHAQNRGAVEVFVDSLATESAIAFQGSLATCLHIATHGFFIDQDCRHLSRVGPELPGSHVGGIENPLLQSGLLLAGANRMGRGETATGHEDGVMTAEEVCSIDLRNVACVVLSACETGLGEVMPGEGVFGLRRAFQVAGAATVISSLWSVPDYINMELWRDTYSRLDRPVPEFMQTVARNALERIREHGEVPHPAYWAPFIALGDWHAPLQN